MRIVTAAEMGAADKKSVAMGVPVATLMENAGAAVARFVATRFSELRSIVVVCGKGNNGGDGMVAARLLAEGGCNVRVLLLGQAADLKGDAKTAWDGAQKSVACVEVSDAADLRRALAEASLVVDAVVGTGFKPPLRGLALAARDVLRALTM
ncbi:MAG: NAD(P)H-hydrate epimerase, partial [Bryocella sp.]